MSSPFEHTPGLSKRPLSLPRGAYLFRRGEIAERVFTVASGRLRLERSLEDGTAVTLAILGPGAGVAEAALFAPAYHCDARAEVQSRLWVYAKDEVLAALDRDGEGMMRLIKQLAGQVRRLRALIEVRAIRPADRRVLAYLDLLEALGETWDDARPSSAVAAELGLTPETLYRALGRLARKGMIVRNGRRVRRKG